MAWLCLPKVCAALNVEVYLPTWIDTMFQFSMQYRSSPRRRNFASAINASGRVDSVLSHMELSNGTHTAYITYHYQSVIIRNPQKGETGFPAWNELFLNDLISAFSNQNSFAGIQCCHGCPLRRAANESDRRIPISVMCKTIRVDYISNGFHFAGSVLCSFHI